MRAWSHVTNWKPGHKLVVRMVAAVLESIRHGDEASGSLGGLKTVGGGASASTTASNQGIV